MSPKRLARLVYLSAKLGTNAPDIPRALQWYLPDYELLMAVRLGSEAASALVDISAAQLRKMFESGKKQGPPSETEYRILIAKEIEENGLLEDLDMQKRFKILSSVHKFLEGENAAMVTYGKTSLGTSVNGRAKPLQKWESGFTPLDLVTGGLYQGIIVLVSNPGGGKTSTMLTLAGEIKRSHPDWRIRFYEEEIPEGLMLSRMTPLFKQKLFTDDDSLVTGGLSMDDIEEDLRQDEDYNRVIFIDSPDSMPGVAADNRRFELGMIYRQLVRVKDKAQLVVVASQPRRKDKGDFRIDSLAESWEKAWFADMIVGLWKAPGHTDEGLRKYRMRCVKNRFGIQDLEVTYDYDLINLTFADASMDDEDW